MTDILSKVQLYLDKVSKDPGDISEKLVEEFGEACKVSLRRQFSEKRRDKFQARMSNIGRPLCQLQMEAKNIKGEGQPYNVKMRNTFGDLIEALSIFVLKSAGVKIEDEQKNVKYKFNGSAIEGRYDVKINKKIWDIKNNQLSPTKVIKGKVADKVADEKAPFYVDGISGATMTSKGVTEMVDRWLNVYEPFFKKIRKAE